MHDYGKIAAIVGEDKINALREAGVEIADKPSKPTTGLLGRWAKTPDGKDVLIISESVKDNGRVWVAFHTDDEEDGAATIDYCLSSLTFPEETTRPEDVPVGEAWLVNVDDGTDSATNVSAVKRCKNIWSTKTIGERGKFGWLDSEVTLIAPLVPARPMDSDRERKYWEQQAQIDSYEREQIYETVTTVQEYVSLPTGSIVAEKECYPVCKRHYDKWESNGTYLSNGDVAGKSRQVLRKGWGE